MTDEIKLRIEQINRGEVPQGYKKTEVGIVPCEWKVDKLRSIGFFEKGRGIPGTAMKKEGVPCVGYGDIYTKYNYKFDKAVNFVDEDVAKTGLEVNKGALLFTCSGETAIEIGKCVCYTGEDPIYAGGDIAVLNIEKDIDPLFVAYQQNISASINKKATYGQGHSVVHIYSDSLGKLEIAYPKDIKEQQHISEILSKWDEAISLQEELIEKIKLRNENLINKILLNTKTKKQVALKDVLSEQSIKTKENNQHPVISSTKQGLFLQSEYFDKQVASEENIGYKILKKGQIVLSPQNLWLGNINYNDKYDIGIVSPSYKIFNIKDGYNSVLISTIMSTEKMYYEYAQASEQGASIVRRNLNMDLFYEISMTLPDIEEQNLLAKQITVLRSYIEKQSEKLDKMKQQQTVIQQLLLTGVVRV